MTKNPRAIRRRTRTGGSDVLDEPDHSGKHDSETTPTGVAGGSGSRWDRVRRYYEGADKVISTIKNVGLIAGAVLGYVYACGGSSHTSLHFAEANNDVIKLWVSTEAPKLKRAYLREFRVNFVGLPIEDAELRVVSDSADRAWAVVKPDEPSVVRLTVDRLRGRCRGSALSGQPDRFTKAEIFAAVPNGQARLTVFVQESNDSDSQHHVLTQVVPAKALEEFIDNYLPSTTPEKTSC
ncbi:MAG TPA: hypothetical protein VGQ46_04315 [Thermoanaerobaculia bacterium]|jgi:hypothetical protein|nr:hypothetical protein [Thermoanaerobaculia bacterium]